MKITVILAFCLLAFSLAAVRLYFDYDLNLETSYSSNVLKLSEHDLNRFNNNLSEDKFKLKTTDDLINSARFRFEFKHYLVRRHTQKHELFFKYSSYLQNSFLDNGFLGYRFSQYLNRKINFNLSYFYYPYIYVNRYRSELDNLTQYRDFSYAKNDYQAELNWKAHSLVELSYRFAYIQYYYNKYFTEYDANAFDYRITAGLFPQAKIRAGVFYEYRVAKAKAEDAFEDPSAADVIKDFSYEANRYHLSFMIPRLLRIGKRYLYFSTRLHYEQLYFNNDDPADAYHYGREDYTATFTSTGSYRLTGNMRLRIAGKYQQRKTRSPYANVRRDKNFDLFETGLRISYEF